jgi:aminocarboxymuconate-semialdehyde decarboxylase
VSGERTVDAHAHVIVPGLGADVRWDGNRQVVSLDGYRIQAAVREIVDVGRILEEQDRAGIDVIVLSPWINLCGIQVERQNEALAELACERVFALGTVDLERPEQLVELMKDGRLRGVEIPTVSGGDLLGHPRFRDFWAAAEETHALVFVHPSIRGIGGPLLGEHYFWNTIGNPFETTLAAAHLLATGVVDDASELRILLAHGGGVLAALRGRLAHERAIHPGGADLLASMRQFYVDTVVHDTDVLRDVVDFFGSDHVLLGSDYPFDMGVERPLDIVAELALQEDDRAAILGGNALRLLGQP